MLRKSKKTSKERKDGKFFLSIGIYLDGLHSLVYMTRNDYFNIFPIRNYRYLEATAKKGIALCVLDRAEEATQLLFDCMKFVDHTDAKV